MRYKHLEDYISTLSESEKEEYKHLIAEHRERDAAIRKNCDDLRKKLDMWVAHLEKNAETIEILTQFLHEFEASLSDLNAKMRLYVEIVSHAGLCERLVPLNYPISLN